MTSFHGKITSLQEKLSSVRGEITSMRENKFIAGKHRT
jgi:hypothetical protein